MRDALRFLGYYVFYFVAVLFGIGLLTGIVVGGVMGVQLITGWSPERALTALVLLSIASCIAGVNATDAVRRRR
jgi:cytochrome bd-type quinol oxidase subunit 1